MATVKERTIKLDGKTMNYIHFGEGVVPLCILPGLSDGLKTVNEAGPLMWMNYKGFEDRFSVYIFSRKDNMPEGYTTRDMARDQARAMEKIGLLSAYVMGISQGGMIAQHLAIDYPHRVKKLVLVVTTARPTACLNKTILNWIDLARKEAFDDLAISTIEKNYSHAYLKVLRLLYPVIRRMSQSISRERFLILAYACLTHDAYDSLSDITMPTFIVGAKKDHVLGGAKPSLEIKSRIADPQVFIYSNLGHGAYIEDKIFEQRVEDFLLNSLEVPKKKKLKVEWAKHKLSS